MSVAAEVQPAPALELRGVHAAYERVEILHGIDLVLPAGTVVALLGPNGAGKTTTLRVASGRLRPTAGSVMVEGTEHTKTSPERLARNGLCSVPEGRAIFPNLTVAENLRMWTYRGGLKRSEVEEAAFSRFPRLAERRRQAAGTLSGGEQQMLALSRALATNPTVLLLDEISMGLAPIVVGELYEVVAQIAAEGHAILIVEQFAQAVLEVAELAIVMTQGRIERQGPPAEIAGALSELYLRGSNDAERAGPSGRERASSAAPPSTDDRNQERSP